MITQDFKMHTGSNLQKLTKSSFFALVKKVNKNHNYIERRNRGEQYLNKMVFLFRIGEDRFNLSTGVKAVYVKQITKICHYK